MRAPNVIKLRYLNHKNGKKCCLATCHAPFTHPIFASPDHPLSLREIEGSYSSA
jgi:hypothetical protein